MSQAGRAGALPALPPPPQVAEELVRGLRADLHTLGFTVEGLADLLGPAASAALHRDQLLPARRVLARSQAPLAALAALFALGDQVPADRLDAALPRVGADGLRELGLVLDAERAGCVRAACDLHPYGDEEHTWWVASDLGELLTGAALDPGHVLGVGGASMTLASWAPRPQVGRVLDLGTGCGVQALHASRHAEQVVVTDVSTRALAFARFNAAMAGQVWDVRAGDMFEPVAGERFDLILSNPPFVVTPRTAGLPTYEYRDGGRVGDALVQELVACVGDYLAPGGIACFLANWEVAPGQDWRQVWESWLAGTELDAYVIQREMQDVAEYAEMWSRDSGQLQGVDGERWYSAWLDDFEARGVERVGFGVVVLAAPSRPRAVWQDLVEATGPVAAPMGPSILAAMRARTWLAEHDQDALLQARWSLAPDVTEERHSRPGAADPTMILLRQGCGLGRTVRLDTVSAAFVSVCDGELSARSALVAIAALLDLDAEAVIQDVYPTLRGLVADGFLTLSTG
ncbi:DUF7059 domain-containing protein [Gephyromycinifex aptenodytis]|uniref:DUF7059 domain-containing protein n=1 Tax=Gephyromycinifex aptenodytis TaxID=2716227 RepID=UPI001D025963|nr:methyltransferase [Gephyromycinifex aptenodytis]